MKTQQWQWTQDAGWGSTPPLHEADAAAQLVFVFAEMSALERSKSIPLVRAAFPNSHIVGCTTAGEIAGATVRDNTAVVTAVKFRASRVEAGRVLVPDFEDCVE